MGWSDDRYTPGTSPREAAPRASSTGVTFGLSPRYGLHTARDAHEWFIGLVRERDEFEVETGRATRAVLE